MSNPARSFSSLRAVAAAVLALSAVAGHAKAAQPVVGQVSLVIGEARVQHIDGSSEVLRRGSAIQVGDRIETTGNGHVHVRFVDNGVVSVRPDSVLEVQSYRYDANNPAVNEVRLRLDQGASRSISGAATEVDKTRFRLNTPIAAIGVRGTDFIVQSDKSGVRATVADGAIVMGPLSGDCTASSMGPCAGDDVRVLSAGMGRLMAELRAGEAHTRLVPTSGTVMALLGSKRDEAQHQHGQGDALVYAVNDRKAADLLTVVAEAREVVLARNAQPDANAQLVWGRWGGNASDGDRVGMSEFLAQTGRAPTGVGDSETGFQLYRAWPTQGGGLFPSSLNASVDFALSRASATFTPKGSTTSEVAYIETGALTIDFARLTWATKLPVTSASGGSHELVAGGSNLNSSNGTFAVVDKDNAKNVVRGAVSIDGKEAGYLFKWDWGTGTFNGRTLWGAKPAVTTPGN